MTTTTLTGWQATAALARLSLKRAARGKALWVTMALSLVPTLYAIAFRAADRVSPDRWEGAVMMTSLLLTVIPPILVASSIADEIDDKTSAYLWSRALPRWSIVLGKFLGLVPIAIAAPIVAVAISFAVLGSAAASVTDLERAVAGLALGTMAASAIAAMIATVMPRFAVAGAVCWLLLIDAPVGALDLNLHVVTASFGARTVAGFGGDASLASALISLAVITAGGLAIAIRRMERIE